MKKKILDLNSIVVQKKGIDTTDINGEKAMMDLDKGKYFVLNSVGSSIWDIIIQPNSVKEIIRRLMEEYDVDNKICEQSTFEFLERLRDAELIHVT